jgi:hypothetical protein
MIGAAEFVGYWDIALAAPPWTPVTSFSSLGLASGWGFNPDCFWPMPINNASAPKFGPASAPVAEQITVVLLDAKAGASELTVNPGAGGGGQGNPQWWDNQALFLFNEGAPYNNAFKIASRQQFDPAAWVEPPILAGPNNNVKQTPLIWKDSQAVLHWGTLNGTTGQYAFDVWDAATGAQSPAFDTNSVNIPFWLSDTNVQTVFNWTNPLDVTNRSFANSATYHPAELYLWTTGLVSGFDRITSPTLDLTILNNSINGGTGGVAYSVAVCPLGFIFVFQTNGTGPTSQRFEVAVIDLDWETYVLCRFFPTDAQSSVQLTDTVSPSICLSPDGSLWFNSTVNTNSDQLYPLMGTWKAPPVANVPQPMAIFELPCFQPCTTLP